MGPASIGEPAGKAIKQSAKTLDARSQAETEFLKKTNGQTSSEAGPKNESMMYMVFSNATLK
jgi:hypothetical protein